MFFSADAGGAFGGGGFADSDNSGQEDSPQDNSGFGPDSPEPNETGNQFQKAEEPAVNPAWNPVLENIPPEFHNKLIPHFKEWDSNYQKGLDKVRNEVQSQYSAYQPFVEQGVEPQNIEQALTLMQALNDNPQQVLEALQQSIGGDQGSNETHQVDPDHYDPDDITNHPKFQELENNFNALVEAMESETQAQQEQRQYEESLKEIETTVETLTPQFQEHYGFEMDTEQVLRLAIQNMEMGEADNLDIPAAAKQWGDMINQYRAPAPTPGQMTPNILPTSGGIPQANVDIAKLSGDEREQFVANMLASANKEN